ncbi:hypothetical protein PF005_g8669 [Phytophthora fragariae]|uniref:Uncharacterized protein n=2 Tax=Phytophthora fragariae TaxID=53985 RepID=A0A6A4DZG8_9STRA|nr:hypothetical protein PF010_g8287 [Phytophthora fragariae]KAE9217416.1 hypothetical protein PF005_g8669 [Phytophthora fragariae]KAE9315133.1 hypothetical protein PF001_g7945 [Phytophthora fragariae]
MMRRSCRSHAQHDEDEDDDERVVYYDLDADSHTRNLLLSPVAESAPRSAPQASADAQIFPRQQPPLFSLDDSGDEAEETEEQENPFATLIQQQQAAKPAQDEAAGDRGNSFLQVSATATSEDDAAGQSRGRVDISTNNSVGRPILKRRQEVKGFNAQVTTKKKLGFESADSRPTRWSTQKPSAADTKNRRKSLGAIQKRRSQLEAASAKRRKSMSPSLSGPRTAQLTSNLDDSVDGSSAAPKRKSLSDVLQRATMLSQQQSTANDESLLSQTPATDPTDGDAILDTEHQMRTEPFAPQIFSPSKPVPAAGAISRKSKADGLISKVRGSIGDALRKAIRKSNRDLTLLRSRGQHLLPQQSNHSSSKGTVGAIESIQERGHIVVCLQQISIMGLLNPLTPQHSFWPLSGCWRLSLFPGASGQVFATAAVACAAPFEERVLAELTLRQR